MAWSRHWVRGTPCLGRVVFRYIPERVAVVREPHSGEWAQTAVPISYVCVAPAKAGRARDLPLRNDLEHVLGVGVRRLDGNWKVPRAATRDHISCEVENLTIYIFCTL